eukprot:COSAG03_NODE_23470_length_279_cov_1.555556_1_plen_54_part_10
MNRMSGAQKSENAREQESVGGMDRQGLNPLEKTNQEHWQQGNCGSRDSVRRRTR